MASALSVSAKGASYLILVQVTSRALTFVINQALLRFLSPEFLGASTQLELYSISVLYFARESLRVALQRQTGDAQVVVNASYISILLGIPLAYFFAALYAGSTLPQVPFMLEALYIYGFASVVELLAEPSFAVTQLKLRYQTRASAETAGTILRCLVTFSTVVWCHYHDRNLGVLSFAFGQASYATCLLIVYYFRTVPIARAEKFSLLPKRILAETPKKDGTVPNVSDRNLSSASSEYFQGYFSIPLLTLATNMYLQSGIKYVLTQGDSILITSMATLYEQGAYALASNYGGLVARMVFQPIEESSRNMFAKLSSPVNPANGKLSTQNSTQARHALQDILRFYNIFALISWSVGPALAPLLLQLVAGRKWSDAGAGDVLATYCYYIPLLALNGVTEAFVAAVATNPELQTQSIFMGAYFAGFASAAYLFLKVMGLGAQGLVWANCVNMLLRILWNTRFINSYFFAREKKKFSITAIMPTFGSCAASACASSVLMIARGGHAAGDGVIRRLTVHGAISASLGVLLLLLERDFLIRCYQLTFPKQPSTPKVT